MVFGLGGIGLNVVQGAHMAGADMIVGVDLNPAREALARKFGMTHFVNPKDVKGRSGAASCRVDKGRRGIIRSECIGNVDADASRRWNGTHRGWGESIIIGVAGSGQGDQDASRSSYCHRPRV